MIYVYVILYAILGFAGVVFMSPQKTFLEVVLSFVFGPFIIFTALIFKALR